MKTKQQVITLSYDLRAGDNIINVGVVEKVTNLDNSVLVFLGQQHSLSVFVISYTRRTALVVERDVE